jgi:hypothetical protein
MQTPLTTSKIKIMKNRLPYEDQVFSQNLEDGIILELVKRLINQNFKAIEIGSGNGTQNMLRNLIENHNYHGIGHDMIESTWSHPQYQHNKAMIDLDNLKDTMSDWGTQTPDFFSLDIDSIDFWILKELLKNNFRPSIMCIEYLSYYGPDAICSIKSGLSSYHARSCGASVSAFKELCALFGYKFFTVDSIGVNCFFYLPERLKTFEEPFPIIHNFQPCKRYWNVPIPTKENLNVEFDIKILLE